MSQIDLLLINPSNRSKMYGSLASSYSAIEPPLWTGLIAAYVREKGFSVEILDAEALGWTPEYTAEEIVKRKPILAGISVIGANPSASSTPKMPAVSQVLKALKKASYSSIKTFIFGIHPSALPERTLREEPVAFLCRGECFYTVVELLKVLKSKKEELYDYRIEGLWFQKEGRIISNGWGKCISNIDELPFVAWDLLPMDKYRAHNWHSFYDNDQRSPYAVIYTSLGCPYNCKFCNIHTLYSGRPGIRFRSPQKVVDEISFLVENYKVRNIKIIDEMFTLRQDRVSLICDLIIQRKYNLNMWAYARIDTINDEQLLNKMKQAGINWLAFGIEAASKDIRESICKGKFNEEKIKKVLAMVHKAGIYVVGNFIFGLPGENLETMRQTLDLAKELNCEFSNFYTAMAYPGSELYEEAIAKHIPLPNTWLGYSQYSEETMPLCTEYLSSTEILRFRDEAFHEYFTNNRYLKMIEDKFGPKAVAHIREMVKHKIERKLLN